MNIPIKKILKDDTWGKILLFKNDKKKHPYEKENQKNHDS